MKLNHLVIICAVIIFGIGLTLYVIVDPNRSNLFSTSNMSKSSTLTISMDDPVVNYSTLSYGNGSVKFVTSEQFPITLFSSEKTHVKIKAINMPDGVWIKFIPQDLDIGPGESNVNMMMAGAVKPFVSSNNYSLIVQASTQNNNVAKFILPIRQTGDLTILNSSAPIDLTNILLFDINGTSYQTFGVVFDSVGNSNDSLSVNLSVSGLLKNGTISELPSWLKMEIPQNSFLLKEREPYYFVIGGLTSFAPVGNYVVVINENIDGQHFTRDLKITVDKPIRI